MYMNEKYNTFFNVFSRYLNKFFKNTEVSFWGDLKKDWNIKFFYNSRLTIFFSFFERNNFELLKNVDLFFVLHKNNFYLSEENFLNKNEKESHSLENIRRLKMISDELFIFIFILFFEIKKLVENEILKAENVEFIPKRKEIKEDFIKEIIKKKDSLIEEIKKGITKEKISEFFKIYESTEKDIRKKIIMIDNEIDFRRTLLANDLFEKNENEDKEPKNNKNRNFLIFFVIILLVLTFFYKIKI